MLNKRDEGRDNLCNGGGDQSGGQRHKRHGHGRDGRKEEKACEKDASGSGDFHLGAKPPAKLMDVANAEGRAMGGLLQLLRPSPRPGCCTSPPSSRTRSCSSSADPPPRTSGHHVGSRARCGRPPPRRTPTTPPPTCHRDCPVAA